MKRLGTFADRLAKGSSILSVRLARGTVAWLKAGKSVGDFLIRLGFLALPLWILWTLVAATRALLWILAAVWCIAAWRAAQPAKARTPPPPRPFTSSGGEEAGQETHTEIGGGVRVVSTPDPAHPTRIHVRVEQANADAPR
ncbi:hypothetical protein [Streptomyces sp. NPDC021020]|uniref:hypothetical protein n=1 Tax=Streptomyces sp. NPDC021020 TaxID=3365109 RepID=UPI00378A89B2